MTWRTRSSSTTSASPRDGVDPFAERQEHQAIGDIAALLGSPEAGLSES